MKKIFLLFALMITVACTAQTDSTLSSRTKYKLGLALNVSSMYENPTSVLMTFSKNKHQFDVGPILHFNHMSSDDRMLGLDFYYRYYPQGTDNRINSFLYANTSYQNKFWYRSFDYAFAYGTTVYPGNDKLNSNILYTSVGYGLNLKLSNKLYLASNVGLGYSIENGHYSHEYSDPSLNFSNRFSIDNINFSGSLTLGYRF